MPCLVQNTAVLPSRVRTASATACNVQADRPQGAKKGERKQQFVPIVGIDGQQPDTKDPHVWEGPTSSSHGTCVLRAHAPYAAL